MSDKRISQLVERTAIENNDVLPIVALGASTTNKVTITTIEDYMQSHLDLGVTSIGLTKTGDALAITGSPVTSAGTINIAFAGTSGQYVNGAGNLATFPALTGYVPYTGATADVDLGTYGLIGDYARFNTTPSSVPITLGTLSWDTTYRTLQLIDGDGDTTLQIGQEQRALIHNNTGATLTDGQVVYVTGSTGNLPSVALASNTTEASSSVTFGVVTETIANGADGFVTISGNVNGLNTLAFNEGDALYLGATAGTFTNVKPTAPANLVLIGYMIKKSGGNGIIFVKIQNGYELEELHDVSITSVANNDGLFWDSATSLWKNKTIAGVLGYTPADDSLVVHLAGVETITGGKFFNAFAQFNANVTHNAATLNYANNVFFHSATLSNYSGATSMVGVTNGLKFGLPSGATSQFNFPSIVGVVYTFPSGPTSSGGTLALTSDLGSYLPLTGGTLTGKLTINTGGVDNQLQLNGTAPSVRLTNAVTGATINGFIAMAGTAGDYILTSAVGDMCIGNQNSGKIMFGFGSGTANPKMTIDASGNGVFSGTISATGGTLTGALSGTSAVFSGNITVGEDLTLNNIGTAASNILATSTSGTLSLTAGATSGYTGGGTIELVANDRSGTNTRGEVYISAGNASANTANGFISLQTANTERLRVTYGGEVQINTTTVYGSKLTVNGSIYQIDGTKGIYSNNFGVLNGGGTNLSFEYSSGGNVIWGNGSERMRITSGGTLCVGSTSALNTNTSIEGYKSVNADSYATFRNDGNGTSTRSRVDIVSNGQFTALIQNSSAHSTPGYFLIYNTGNRITMQSAGSGGVYLSGGATSWTSNSDERLKNINGTIDSALSKLMSLRAVNYSWKYDSDAKENLGLIAQDVEKVFPQVIDKGVLTTDDKGTTDGIEYLGVRYQELVPVLVKAIQEQQAQIEELKALIEAK